MRQTLRSAAFVALLSTPCFAAEPMNGAQFEAYVGGRTLSSLSGGEPYGIEAYHPGRGVTWAFVGGECQRGEWYAKGPDICFVYEDRPGDPQCWTFQETSRGLVAQFENDPTSTELYEAEDLGEEMLCYGPDVGV